MITEFPRTIPVGDYLFLFSEQKGRLLLTRSRALILCSIFPVKKKYSNQNKLNIGMINFQCQWPQRQNLNRH